MFGKDKIVDPYNTMGAPAPQQGKPKRRPKDEGLVVDGVINGIASLGFGMPKIKVRKNGTITTVTGKSPGITVTAVYDESTGQCVVHRKIGK
jgi:hypothetical protein